MKILFSALVAAFTLNVCVSATGKPKEPMKGGKALSASLQEDAPNYEVLYCVPTDETKKPICTSEPIYKTLIQGEKPDRKTIAQHLNNENFERTFRSSNASAALNEAIEQEKTKNPELKLSSERKFLVRNIKDNKVQFEVKREFLISGSGRYYFWHCTIPLIIAAILAFVFFYFFGGSYVAVGQACVAGYTQVKKALGFTPVEVAPSALPEGSTFLKLGNWIVSTYSNARNYVISQVSAVPVSKV